MQVKKALAIVLAGAAGAVILAGVAMLVVSVFAIFLAGALLGVVVAGIGVGIVAAGLLGAGALWRIRAIAGAQRNAGPPRAFIDAGRAEEKLDRDDAGDR